MDERKEATMKVAQFLGFDLSTSGLKAIARSADGQEDFVEIGMQGQTTWQGQPGFILDFVPEMIKEALEALVVRGWHFCRGGNVSFSVRQHDMVLLSGRNMSEPLIPALSWQCNVATYETNIINNQPDIVASIGLVQPRFILPKLLWVMRNFPEIGRKIGFVLTTGDYIALMLTGHITMSSSDALSNGLLDQKTRRIATTALDDARRAVLTNLKVFLPGLFLAVQSSGTFVGHTDSKLKVGGPQWAEVRNILAGWCFYASLGDNHASGVGCGLVDNNTIAISAGSSGTVFRKCAPRAKLRGEAARFEFYNDTLLLTMLADCAVWYNKFVATHIGKSATMAQLDQAAMGASFGVVEFWNEERREGLVATRVFSPNLEEHPRLIASAQLSIAVELLLLTKAMLVEVKGNRTQVRRFVITGGMSRSPFFRTVLSVGLGLLKNDANVFVSARNGKSANEAATLGALINAITGSGLYYNSRAEAVADLCPLKPAQKGLPKYRNMTDLRRRLEGLLS